MSLFENEHTSEKRSLEAMIQKRLGRRELLGGGLGLAASGLLGGFITNCSQSDATKPTPGIPPSPRLTAELRDTLPLLGFTAIAPILDQSFDRVMVPKGYRAEAFYSWGDALVVGAKQALADAKDSAADQMLQAGQSHDGMIFFAWPNDPSRALLVINHEDIESASLHPRGQTRDLAGLRPLAEVEKELAAIGVSVLEIQRNKNGLWERVSASRMNRRITATTPMRLSGPAAGHPLMATEADPFAQTVLGTMNNCAAGRTPWGTYLTCEENFNKYFANRDEADLKSRREQSRYGISSKSEEGWDSVMERFDATLKTERPHGAYVNEVNRFGWVVEIDPFDPQSLPKKRTALGRFAHENVGTLLAEDGRMAFYMGDDSRGEYIYKFMPQDAFKTQSKLPAEDLLDEGTLAVAVFHENGTGEWVDLVHGRNGLDRSKGFMDQAEVLVNTRSAADLVGATPMDRPEWITIHPTNHDIYVSLTNNSKRGNGEAQQALNAANPRANNIYGHIIRISETNADPHSRTFRWEFYLQAGDPLHSDPLQRGTINGDAFGSPDGLWFDKLGRLWIQTDFDDADPAYTSHIGLNMLLASDPSTREVKRFLVGPKGCEITGIASDAELKTLWVNVQHPTLSYPSSDGRSRPRSTTVMITKEDGGMIGT